jgi:hypothetical protein
MSQNLTFTVKDQADIERIKPMLLEGKTQLEMSMVLGLRRETINRKMQRWVQTPDFEAWLKQAWLEKYRKVSNRVAFEALTRILARMVTQKREVKEEITKSVQEEISINVFTDDEKSILDRAARLLDSKGARKPSDLH